MEKEKFNVLPEDQELAHAIHETFPDMPACIIEAELNLPDAEREVYLKRTEKLAKDIPERSSELLRILQEKRERKNDKKNEDTYQEFSQIEKDVLDCLPLADGKRIQTTIARLRKKYGKRYDAVYQEAIMKLHRKDVIIKEDTVQFLYAHVELDKQEVQFPTGDRVINRKYPDFEDGIVSRKEIRQMVMDEKNHSAYYYLQKIKAAGARHDKYMATKENAFGPILSGFSGELDQQIKGMQILRGFVGKVIASEERNEKQCRIILRAERSNHFVDMRGYFRGDDSGSIIFAKQC